jgi:hypothetical protein
MYNVKKYYKRDPRWVSVKYPCVCANCRAEIKPGTQAFYYPSTGDFFGMKCGCATRAYNDFMTMAEAEEYYATGGRGYYSTRMRENMEGRQIGSQFRQTLSQAGYKLVKYLGDGEVILQNEDGGHELWFKHDDNAGWTIEIRGVGYEFARRVPKYRVVKSVKKVKRVKTSKPSVRK